MQYPYPGNNQSRTRDFVRLMAVSRAGRFLGQGRYWLKPLASDWLAGIYLVWLNKWLVVSIMVCDDHPVRRSNQWNLWSIIGPFQNKKPQEPMNCMMAPIGWRDNRGRSIIWEKFVEYSKAIVPRWRRSLCALLLQVWLVMPRYAARCMFVRYSDMHKMRFVLLLLFYQVYPPHPKPRHHRLLAYLFSVTFSFWVLTSSQQIHFKFTNIAHIVPLLLQTINSQIPQSLSLALFLLLARSTFRSIGLCVSCHFWFYCICVLALCK